MNESVEEVRWKLTENEEDLKRKIAEEAEEDFSSLTCEQRSDDITLHASNYVNVDNSRCANSDVTHSLNNYENLNTQKDRNYENVDSSTSRRDADVTKPMKKASPSAAVPLRHHTVNMHASARRIVSIEQSGVDSHSRQMVSGSKHHETSILSNPTYATIEIREESLHSSPEQKRTSKRNAASPNNGVTHGYEFYGFSL